MARRLKLTQEQRDELRDAWEKAPPAPDETEAMLPYTEQLPPVLRKAAHDQPWTYLIQLSSGQQFICSGIDVINEEWLHLLPCDPSFVSGLTPRQLFIDCPIKKTAYIIHERGISVRLSEIAFAADGYS